MIRPGDKPLGMPVSGGLDLSNLGGKKIFLTVDGTMVSARALASFLGFLGSMFNLF